MTDNGVRVVTMQQSATIQPADEHSPVMTADEFVRFMDSIDEIDRNQRNRAAAELAQAVDDGYEIVNVAIGGNDRVLLTTWTLRRVVHEFFIDYGVKAAPAPPSDSQE